MISSVESISKPVIATATPVNELSSEITTGMSAPPIGSTKSTPSSSAAASKREESPRRQRVRRCTTNQTAKPDDARAATSALTTCCPGYVIGRPVISSCSLRNATIEPAKLIAPMIAESTSETATTESMPPAGVAMKNCTVEMSAAAPPPAPL